MYIVPKIIRIVKNEDFLEFRKKELELRKKIEIKDETVKTNVIDDSHIKIEEESIVDDQPNILSEIERLDAGEGVYIDEIVKELNLEDDKKIRELLERGDIFEVKPGKIKVL